MALSSRMQNLAKQSLIKNPSISRDSLHNMASKMMGKKGVTGSVVKVLKKTGHFYGPQRLSRHQYEQAAREISEHLKEQGVKENRFTKDIRESLRSRRGLIRGSAAEKLFENEIKKEITAVESTEMDPKTKNRLRTKLIQGHKLTKRDLEGVPKEELYKLKGLIGALKNIHQRETAEQIERESKNQTDEKKLREKAQTSASSSQKEGDKEPNSNDVASSKGQSTVPLQGGLGSGNNLERREAMEQLSILESGSEFKKTASKDEENTESPPVNKESSSDDEKEDISDMEIG